MISNFIMVNTITLSKNRDEVSEQLKFVEEKMNQMKASVLELNRMWSGNANQAFNQAFCEDMEFLISVCKNMQRIINFESNAIQQYDACENKINDMIQQIVV